MIAIDVMLIIVVFVWVIGWNEFVNWFENWFDSSFVYIIIGLYLAFIMMCGCSVAEYIAVITTMGMCIWFDQLYTEYWYRGIAGVFYRLRFLALIAPVFVPAGELMASGDLNLQYQYQGVSALVFVEQVLHNAHSMPLNTGAWQFYIQRQVNINIIVISREQVLDTARIFSRLGALLPVQHYNSIPQTVWGPLGCGTNEMRPVWYNETRG